MASTILDTRAIGLIKNSPTSNSGQRVSIGINGRIANVLLLGPDAVQQPFRTQFDVAIDGSEYVVAAGKGIGSYTFNVLEGPFCESLEKTQETILDRITGFGTSLQGRRMFMTLNNGRRTGRTFNGVICNVTTAVDVSSDGARTIVSSITAAGSWK